ncbi:MAG TPA: translocation/assembly module TamB domain-containing protein [Verrucomicrobiales bacterium]|nr:translocation/assembly module TamB domain-containing protein [Verrucomicrobiales bacterium]
MVTRETGRLGAEPSRTRRRRRWPWVLGGFLLLCGLAAVFVNGPGFRWAANAVVRKALAQAGYRGKLQIEGTLWSGVQAQSLGVESIEDGTRVEASGLRVSWDLPAILRRGWPEVVRAVEVREARVVIDLSDEQAKRKERGRGIPHELRFPMREFPVPSVDIANVSVTLLLPEGRRLVGEGFRLEVPKGKPGRISLDRLEIPGGPRLENLSGSVAASGDRIVLRDVSIMEDLELRSLEVRIGENGGPLELEAELDLGTGTLRVSSVLLKEATIRLEEGGALATADLVERLGWEKAPVAAEVDRFSLQWSGDLEHPQGWEVSLDVGWRRMQAAEVELDRGAAGFVLKASRLSGQGLNLRAGENRLDAVVEAPVPSDLKDWTIEGFRDLPIDVRLELDAPALRERLEAAGLAWSAASVLGHVQARWKGDRPESVEGRIEAREVGQGTALAPLVEWNGVMASDAPGQLNNRVRIELGGANAVSLEADVQLDDLSYVGRGEGRLGNLADLSILPFLPEESRNVAGAVAVDWSGSGSLLTLEEQSGSAGITLEGVEWGGSAAASGRIELGYAAQRLVLDLVSLEAEGYRLEVRGAVAPDQATLDALTLRHGESVLVAGSARVPIDPNQKGMGMLWEAGEPVELRLRVERLSLEKIQELAGQEWGLAGEVNLEAEFSGPLRELEGAGQLKASGLQVQVEGAEFEPAEIELALRLASGEVVLEGSARQARLQPVELELRTRFAPADWEAQLAAPISGRVRLPPTEIGWVPSLVEGLESADGTLEVELDIAGTLGAPVLTGDAGLQATRITLTEEAVEPFRDVRVQVTFSGRELRVEQMTAQMAGGGLAGGGSVNFTDSANPVLDLTIKSERALLQRDEEMILRADADLRVTGPWAGARVEGTVALTESRYYRTIELFGANVRFGSGVPQAPQRRASPLPRFYRIGMAPFDDWEFDVRVTARQPFRVRSNLMTANVVPDFRVTGRGAALGPVGRVAVTEGFVTLPFSRMELEEGGIDFTPDTGVPGSLRVLGWSQVGEYRVRILLGGDLNNVRSSFTSNPPLSREDILSLLATGTTREELLSGENVAATRAASLMFQQAWRKLRKQEWVDPTEIQRNPLTIEPIGVDPKTGRNLAMARLRLLEWLYLQGSADVEGGFRGMIKLLFEF